MKNILNFFSSNAAILYRSFFFLHTEERTSYGRTKKVDVYWTSSRHDQKVEDDFVDFCDRNHLSAELRFSDGSEVFVKFEFNEVHRWISLTTIREDWIEKHGDSPESLQDLMEVEDHFMDKDWYPINPCMAA